MVAAQAQTFLQNLARRILPAAKTDSLDTVKKKATSVFRRRKRPHHHAFNSHPAMHTRTTGLDIARFGLLSIATLPFSIWISLYSWNYIHRIRLCQEALLSYKDDDDEKADSSSHIDERQSRIIGRDRQLEEVRSLLSQAPHQIIVVAGTNESGKSRFVSEILQSGGGGEAETSSALLRRRGVTYIQLAQLGVDSISTLTHAFVRAFDLRWLQMRHALVDVLPFAGSEILVMKERFSSRDMAQSLFVINEGLKLAERNSKKKNERPVIIVDGLGEDSGNGWIRTPEGRRALERLIKWCIYITKERRLAHVILTGNEELVVSLTNQNRATRGHVKVIGLGDLSKDEAGKIVLQELPSATQEEVKRITDSFGGFIHDVLAVAREIQSRVARQSNDPSSREKIFDDVLRERFRQQVELLTACFAKGRQADDDAPEPASTPTDDDDDQNPYLDPLKAIYSEAQASQTETSEDNSEGADSLASWSQLQLWYTLQRLVESDSMSVSFSELRDDVFDGQVTPIMELMNEDILGFEVETSADSGWSWQVKPATFALGRVFEHLVRNGSLKERFQELQQREEGHVKRQEIERERLQLRRERNRLEARKASLMKTVELGKELNLRSDKKLTLQLQDVYMTLAAEEFANEQRGRQLRQDLAIARLAASKATEQSDTQANDGQDDLATEHDHSSIQQRLKTAVFQVFSEEGNKDKFSRFRHAFEQLTANEGGVTAADVVRLIKSTSGEDVDLKAAESFIKTFDLDHNAHLDYDEFVRMLLTDPNGADKRDKKRSRG